MATSQHPLGPLFDVPPHVAGSATSRAAAAAVAPKRPSQKQRIRDYVADCRFNGATRPEIARALNLSENTVRPRVLELIVAASLVEATAVTRDGCTVLFVPAFAGGLG